MRSLAYQGSTLFENLRFRLEGSHWTCLLGASGVGKTSLLRLIAGLAPGALVVADDGRGLDRRVALMAQQDLLLPWLSVVDNVILGFRLRGATRAETIRTASQEGFADANYRDVYQDYKSFAQSSLDSEAMPAPQRRRVKRYFQMIQPRR